jgi:hypothetical protein
MTNGEKLIEVFPSIELYKKAHDGIQINFNSVWFNAEYIEPTTKNDLGVDCVSRADAIKAMQDKAKKLKNEDTINGLCGAVAILFDMPSVTQQEPKTGHWIFVGEENEEETRNGNFRYICSECTYSDVHAKSTEVPYCWHCGAKMVEPQESEDKE